MNGQLWSLEMTFSEDDIHTRADAWLRAGQRELHVVGRAKRNLSDPPIPAIGEQLAAARALSELSRELVAEATEAIEVYEGHRVGLHV
ncbi:MAG TPA: dsRBD fold-containing protein [Actinomycetota bacterium]|nr:dsRBD fold-containing protein [Actinomycetota bacterium]